MRYYSDPRRRAVAELMQAEILRAAEEQKKGGWITYLIRDPREPDQRGNVAGTPIYIGQTKEIPKRVMKRFMTSEKEAKAKDSIERRITDLLRQGVVARYEVLERVDSRLTSLISETNWIKRCRNAGYDLCNNSQEQRFGGDLIGRHDIPKERLAMFTLEEALKDGIDVRVECRACLFDFSVDLERLLMCNEAPTNIGALRRALMDLLCTNCGTGTWRSKLIVR